MNLTESEWIEVLEILTVNATASNRPIREKIRHHLSGGLVGNGCPCEPYGLDGLTCPDPTTGKTLCEKADTEATEATDTKDHDPYRYF